MDRMPNELIDCIIDFLHEDIGTLRACSTVCRTWSPSARHHLLERIYVEDSCRLEAIKLSDAPLSSTKSLWVIPGGFIDEFLSFKYHSKFKNLAELSIYRLISTGAIMDERMLLVCKEFPFLQKLHLEEVKWHSLNALVRFVHSFPLLLHLQFNNVHWGTLVHPFHLDVGTFPVRHLQISDTHSEFVENLLRFHPSFEFRTLLVPNERTSQYGRICTACYKTLEIFDMYELEEESTDTFDLAPFTALTTLALPLDLEPRSVTNVLKRVTSNNIQNIVLFMVDLGPIVWQNWSPDYHLIESIMCTSQFEKATLWIGAQVHEFAEAQTFFPAVLPKLNQERLKVEDIATLCKIHGLNP